MNVKIKKFLVIGLMSAILLISGLASLTPINKAVSVHATITGQMGERNQLVVTVAQTETPSEDSGDPITFLILVTYQDQPKELSPADIIITEIEDTGNKIDAPSPTNPNEVGSSNVFRHQVTPTQPWTKGDRYTVKIDVTDPTNTSLKGSTVASVVINKPTPFIVYPESTPGGGGKWIDLFNRATITPTGAPTVWTSSPSGAGAANNIGTLDTTPSPNKTVMQMVTGATNGNSAILDTSGYYRITPFAAATSGNVNVTFTARVVDASPTNVQIFMGLQRTEAPAAVGNTTSTRTVGFLFHVDGTFPGHNWQAFSADGTPGSGDNTGIAPDTNFHEFTIIWKKLGTTATQADFYIDGNFLLTKTTNMHTAASNIIISIKTNDGVSKTLHVDRILVTAI